MVNNVENNQVRRVYLRSGHSLDFREVGCTCIDHQSKVAPETNDQVDYFVVPWDPLSFIDQARLERKMIRKPDLNMLMQTLQFTIYANSVEC